MASDRARSRSPRRNRRREKEVLRESRRRDDSASSHYRRRARGEAASPARASSELQPPHHPERQRSTPHPHPTRPRRRSRSRRSWRSRSRSVAVSRRARSPSDGHPSRRPRSPSAARPSYTRSHRSQHPSSPAYSSRSLSRDRFQRRSGDFGRSPVRAPRREESSHRRPDPRREASLHRPAPSRASPDTYIAPRHRRRSPSPESTRHHLRTSIDSIPSRREHPHPHRSKNSDRIGREEGGSTYRLQPSTSRRSPLNENDTDYSPYHSDHTRSAAPLRKDTSVGKEQVIVEQATPSSQRDLERSRSPPAFKVKGRATHSQPVNLSRGSESQYTVLDEPASEDAADAESDDEMYNPQWQGGRGGPGQRHPSFGYQQNRGGWQGYQGSPQGYSPQQQQGHFQQHPAGGPQGGYNQQYGGSPQGFHHQQSFGARGGAMGIGRGQPAFGGRGGFRGAQQQSPPAARGGHTAAGPAARGTAHFSNLSWTPQTGSRGGHAPIDKQNSIPAPNLPSAMDKQSDAQGTDLGDDDDDNPFRPPKALRTEDQSAKKEKERQKALEEAQQAQQANSRSEMPPPEKPALTLAEPAGPKFSFTLKGSRAEPQTSTAPKPDLLQKPQQAGPPAVSSTPYREKRFEQSPPLRSRDHRDDPRQPVRARKDQWDERRDDDRSGASDFRPTGFQVEYKAEKPVAKTAFADKDAGVKAPASGPRDVRAGDKRPSGGDVEMRDAPKSPPKPEKKYRKIMVKKLKEKPVMPDQWKKSNSIYYRDETADIVGSGTYGKVYKAANVYTKEVVALKRIRMEGEKDGYPTTAVREIRILQAGSKSSNIVSFLEIMIENNECYMVFEYVEHDLTGLLNNPEFTLSLAHKKDLCRQLFSGIHFCHQNSILHRDIKAANILVTGAGILKIADFGLARIYDKKAVRDEDPKKRPPYTNRVVTIWYRSPELCLGEVYYSTSVDVWSCACVMMEVYTRGAIFPGDGTEMNQYHKIASILGKPTPEIWPALRDMDWYTVFWPAKNTPRIFEEKYGEKMSEKCLQLLSSIFQWDPEVRPSAAEVLEHEFFTEEEPAPQQAVELADLKGDWHEYESKKLRKEKELKEREERHRLRAEEATRAQQQQQADEEVGKRKAGSPVDVDVEVKKAREEAE